VAILDQGPYVPAQEGMMIVHARGDVPK